MGYVNDYGGFTGEGDPYGGMYDRPAPKPLTPEQQEAKRLANRSSGERAIDVQREQYYQQRDLNEPFAQLGRNALAGFGQYQESPEFQQILGQGTRALNRGSSAGGMYDSSQSGSDMAGFINQATGDDVNRQYQQQLNALKIGQGGASAIAGAAGNFGAQGSGIYGNMGNLAAQNALNQGQQSQAIFNTAGNAVSGFGNYLAQQPQSFSFDTQFANNPNMNYGGR